VGRIIRVASKPRRAARRIGDDRSCGAPTLSCRQEIGNSQQAAPQNWKHGDQTCEVTAWSIGALIGSRKFSALPSLPLAVCV
jgi:hypothetical protein